MNALRQGEIVTFVQHERRKGVADATNVTISISVREALRYLPTCERELPGRESDGDAEPGGDLEKATRFEVIGKRGRFPLRSIKTGWEGGSK
jgi:hypothetical protein